MLLFSLALGSALGIYYYLRVIYYMPRQPHEHPAGQETTGKLHGHILSGLLIAGILLLGIAPQSLMQYLRSILP